MSEDWEQCEPLTQRLHNILRDYPNGTQIFRELIQNADDAEASKVVLMLDLRDFSKSTTKLLAPEMRVLQVPSIICYNNATFQEKDFESLKNLGASRKENEPTKTGRFGIGFNSVYVSEFRGLLTVQHLTDFPQLVSGRHILILSPHKEVRTNFMHSRCRFLLARRSIF